MYVTFTGGGVGVPWKDITGPAAPNPGRLDGSPVFAISANPNRGSHELYIVTGTGVFWMANSRAANPSWVNITGNLFSQTLSRPLYGDPTEKVAPLKSLQAIQADWRYAIPDDLSNPNGPTHPVLYVAGTGGVYRSLDKGVTWTLFPDIAHEGSPQDG